MGDVTTLTPELEAKGLKAYEQARAFERLRSWRLPASYAVFTSIPVLSGVGWWWIGHPAVAGFHVLTAVLFALGSWWHWRRLKGRYAENVGVLAEMERTHGDELPWIRMEKHFAELERLKREIAEFPEGRH